MESKRVVMGAITWFNYHLKCREMQRQQDFFNELHSSSVNIHTT